MFGNLLFEESSKEKLERQRLDLPLRTSFPYERTIVAATVFTLAALIIWALFGSISRSILLDGTLLTPGSRHDVVASQPGYLTSFDVSPGDLVSIGDSIARQTVPALEHEIAMFQTRVDLLKQEILSQPQDSALKTLLSATEITLKQLEEQLQTSSRIVSQDKGVVTAMFGEPGDYLAIGTVIGRIRQQESTSERHVVSQISSETSSLIRSGMAAEIELQSVDGSQQVFSGSVISVAAVQPSRVPSPALAETADHHYVVNIKIDLSIDTPTFAEDLPCRIRIQLDRSSPISVFKYVLS